MFVCMIVRICICLFVILCCICVVDFGWLMLVCGCVIRVRFFMLRCLLCCIGVRFWWRILMLWWLGLLILIGRCRMWL